MFPQGTWNLKFMVSEHFRAILNAFLQYSSKLLFLQLQHGLYTPDLPRATALLTRILHNLKNQDSTRC